MRDNKYLADKLTKIWENHFADVPVANNVFVKFGQKAKTRLGSIRFGRSKDNQNTHISITGYFSDYRIPDYVVEGVLAHELAHYSHGFFSPHRRLYRHPHKHKIVDKELTKRGLESILILQKKWLKNNWREYIKENESR